MAVTSSRLSTPHEPWASEKKICCDQKTTARVRLLKGRVQKLEKAAPLRSCFGGRGRASSSAAGQGSGRLGEARGGARGALSMGTPGTAASRQRQGKACCSTPTMVLTGKGTVVSYSGQEFGPQGKKGSLNSTNAQCIWKLIELYGTDNFVNIKLTKKILFFPSLLNRTIWFCCFTCLNFVPTS